MSQISGGVIIAGGTVMPGSGLNTPLTTPGAPVDGVKQVSTLHLASATEGAGTVTVGGYGSFPVAFDDNAAAVKAAIEALHGTLSVTVTGLGTSASPWSITFDTPTEPITVSVAQGTLDQTPVAAESVAGVAGSYVGSIAPQGRVKNVATGDIWENTGTTGAPAFTKRVTIS